MHSTQEWHDLYLETTTDELQKFFDRYLKNIDNGWENTPKVRASLYRYNKVSSKYLYIYIYIYIYVCILHWRPAHPYLISHGNRPIGTAGQRPVLQLAHPRNLLRAVLP